MLSYDPVKGDDSFLYNDLPQCGMYNEDGTVNYQITQQYLLQLISYFNKFNYYLSNPQWQSPIDLSMCYDCITCDNMAKNIDCMRRDPRLKNNTICRPLIHQFMSLRKACLRKLNNMKQRYPSSLNTPYQSPLTPYQSPLDYDDYNDPEDYHFGQDYWSNTIYEDQYPSYNDYYNNYYSNNIPPLGNPIQGQGLNPYYQRQGLNNYIQGQGLNNYIQGQNYQDNSEYKRRLSFLTEMVNRVTDDKMEHKLYDELINYVKKYNDYEEAFKAYESHGTKGDNKKNKNINTYFGLKKYAKKEYKEDEGKKNKLSALFNKKLNQLKQTTNNKKNDNSDDEEDIKISLSNNKINNKNSALINSKKLNNLNSKIFSFDGSENEKEIINAPAIKSRLKNRDKDFNKDRLDDEDSSSNIKKPYIKNFLKDMLDDHISNKVFNEEENEKVRQEEISFATQCLKEWCRAFVEDCLDSANTGLAKDGLKLLDQLFKFEQKGLKDVENINDNKIKIVSKNAYQNNYFKKLNLKNIKNSSISNKDKTNNENQKIESGEEQDIENNLNENEGGQEEGEGEGEGNEENINENENIDNEDEKEQKENNNNEEEPDVTILLNQVPIDDNAPVGIEYGVQESIKHNTQALITTIVNHYDNILGMFNQNKIDKEKARQQIYKLFNQTLTIMMVIVGVSDRNMQIKWLKDYHKIDVGQFNNDVELVDLTVIVQAIDVLVDQVKRQEQTNNINRNAV